MDYYTILDLNENCTKEEIKKKYRELCLIYHPDKNNGDDKQFKKINEAYEILYDDEKRKKYNVSLLFKNIEFTEEDYELLEKYYQQFVNSNEFKRKGCSAWLVGWEDNHLSKEYKRGKKYNFI